MVGVEAPEANNVLLFETPEYEHYRTGADAVMSEVGSVLTLAVASEEAEALAKI